MEDLTREDINRLIEENAKLRAKVLVLTGGKGGTVRPRVPLNVAEKYGRINYQNAEFLSRVIRAYLFPETETKTTQVARYRNGSNYEPKIVTKERVISIKQMTDEQYELYCKAFTKLVDILCELKGDKENG